MRATTTLAVVVLVVVPACAASHERPASTECEPGALRSCVAPACPDPCHGGMQRCADDGASWGECQAACGIPCDGGPPRTFDAAPDPIDASDPDAGVVLDDASIDPTLTRSGWIYVEDAPPASPTITLFAYFGDSSIADVRRGLWSPDCTIVAAVGACFAVSCPMATHTSESAGVVTVELDGTEILSTPMPNGASGAYSNASFFAYTGDASRMLAGGVVTVRASGDVVPAFSATLAAPPGFGGTLPTTVSRTHDLALTWPASAATEMLVVALPETFPSSEPWVLCRVPGAAGALSIPASLLAHFTAGESLSVEALALARATALAPPYAIDVFVGSVTIETATVAP